LDGEAETLATGVAAVVLIFLMSTVFFSVLVALRTAESTAILCSFLFGDSSTFFGCSTGFSSFLSF
jgi:preprotein translocase subunit SecG